MDAAELSVRIVRNIRQLENQINVIIKEAPADRDPYQMKYMDGHYVMAPLLAASAALLAAQVQLQEIIDG